MVTRTKERIFLGVLALLFLWPLAHYALARRYHIDHWRFSGFAMYARPSYTPKLEFAGLVGEQPLTPELLRTALGDQDARVDHFLARRRLWGDLEPPDALARLIFDRLPELSELTITIDTVGLEPGADYLSSSSRRYRCAPPRSGHPVCVSLR